MITFQRILVPVDGSDCSTRGLVTALQLARDSGGRVRLLHLVDDLTFALVASASDAAFPQMLREAGGKILDAAAAIAQSAGVPVDTCLVERPAARLGDAVAGEASAWHADLVVVGSHGRRGLQRLLLGSGAEQVLRLAPVPVLVVRGARQPGH